jgi:hypothetical protein
LLPGASPLSSIEQFPEIQLPPGDNPVATGPTTSGGATGQFTLTTYNVCFTGSTSDVNGPFSGHRSLLANLLGAGWGAVTPNTFPFDGQYQQSCSSEQICFFSGVPVIGRQIEVDSLTDHGNQVITFTLILAFPPTAPSCTANFSQSPISGIQTMASTAYGSMPLPPLSLVVPDSSIGDVYGYEGVEVCSAGTAETIGSFLSTYMPNNGWSEFSATSSEQIWKSSSGCIDVSISDPTDWLVSWPMASLGTPFAACP